MPTQLSRALRASVTVLLLAALVLPTAPSAALIPVEDVPSYQPQTTCNPTAKRGTLMLQSYLLRRYPGSRSSGISRSCRASGVSEHKEGRAFDWALDARSARDRRYAGDFLAKLLATDRAGNRTALARRMGVMYVIWNDGIWSASSGYKRRAYRHAACKTVAGCGTTLRHRDHMHISLTRAAAGAKTSWYLHRLDASAPAPRPSTQPAPKPAPKPAAKPTPTPVRRPPSHPVIDSRGVLDLTSRGSIGVSVATDGSVTRTDFRLRKGAAYIVTAAGLYNYGTPQQVGDAVCTWSPRRPTWSTRPAPRERAAYGPLVLAAGGRRLFTSGCRRSHVYRTRYIAPSTRRLSLSVLGGRPGGAGNLRVVISRAGEDVSPLLPTYPTPVAAPQPTSPASGGYRELTETVTVPASGVVQTRYALEPGAQYRMSVQGMVGLGAGVFTDGRCLLMRGSWYQAASLDLRRPFDEHGDLFVNGVRFNGRAAAPGTAGCGSQHSAVVTAPSTGRFRLSLWDPFSATDNTGSLSVTISRLTPFSTPVAAPRARPLNKPLWRLNRETLTVSSASPAGAMTTMKVQAGTKVRIQVRGTTRSHGLDADAACVRTSQGWVDSDPLNALSLDPLALWVDGRPVRWRPSSGGAGCSATNSYVAHLTTTKSGPIGFSVLDLDHRDNKGALTLTVVRLGR